MGTFGTPICGGGRGCVGDIEPLLGYWALWFGDWGQPDTSYVEQVVTIPAGMAIRLWVDSGQDPFDVGQTCSPNDSLTVYVDNVAAWSLAGDDPITCTRFGDYMKHCVSVDQWGDGQAHTIRVEGVTEQDGNRFRWIVDNVQLVTASVCATAVTLNGVDAVSTSNLALVIIVLTTLGCATLFGVRKQRD